MPERVEAGPLLPVSPPWTWALFWTLAVLLGACLVGSVAGKVELTSRARGALEVGGGVRAVVPQISGAVVEVLARSGDVVPAGTPLLRLESAQLRADLLQADRRLELLESRFRRVAAERDRLWSRRRTLLRSRIALLEQRKHSEAGSEARLAERARAHDQLGKQGALPVEVARETAEEVERARRQRLGLAEAAVTANEQVTALDFERGSDAWRREEELEEARARRDALAFALAQSTLVAPTDGLVEALLVKAGDVVEAGRAVARVVPAGVPARAVAFLPERDRAFVRAGDEVRLELEQLPAAEFGAATGFVTRVAADLASPREVADTLGEGAQLGAPTVRVEVAVDRARLPGSLATRLKPGMLLAARFTLRRQRLVTLALDPLRRWLD